MMRSALILMSAVALIGCAGGEEEMPADTPAAAMAAPLSFADVAGTWSVQSMAETSDSVLITFTLNATADGTGWTMTFPNRPEPVPLTVAVDGDSLIMDAGPYMSALRAESTMVTLRSVSRIQDGMMMGTFTAHYDTQSPDSVLRGRTQGTRVP
jgi:hypothetical protein